jgi:hypothetical protein
MFRGRIPILAGSAAVVLGVLLLAWVNESSQTLLIAEVLGFVLLVPGLLAVFAGCILFCVKEEARKVLMGGAVLSGVSLVLVPLLKFLLALDFNVHGWTGLLFFFVWVPACVIGPALLLAGIIRIFLHRR